MNLIKLFLFSLFIFQHVKSKLFQGITSYKFGNKIYNIELLLDSKENKATIIVECPPDKNKYWCAIGFIESPLENPFVRMNNTYAIIASKRINYREERLGLNSLIPNAGGIISRKNSKLKVIADFTIAGKRIITYTREMYNVGDDDDDDDKKQNNIFQFHPNISSYQVRYAVGPIQTINGENIMISHNPFHRGINTVKIFPFACPEKLFKCELEGVLLCLHEPNCGVKKSSMDGTIAKESTQKPSKKPSKKPTKKQTKKPTKNINLKNSGETTNLLTTKKPFESMLSTINISIPKPDTHPKKLLGSGEKTKKPIQILPTSVKQSEQPTKKSTKKPTKKLTKNINLKNSGENRAHLLTTKEPLASLLSTISISIPKPDTHPKKLYDNSSGDKTKKPIVAPQPVAAPTKRPISTPPPVPAPTTTKKPTITSRPTMPTPRPTFRKWWTISPTKNPTKNPTKHPTFKPTFKTASPTKNPTSLPTPKPTYKPTFNPIPKPTKKPTKLWWNVPTPKPTKHPSKSPTPKIWWSGSKSTKKPTKSQSSASKSTKKPTKSQSSASNLINPCPTRGYPEQWDCSFKKCDNTKFTEYKIDLLDVKQDYTTKTTVFTYKIKIHQNPTNLFGGKWCSSKDKKAKGMKLLHIQLGSCCNLTPSQIKDKTQNITFKGNNDTRLISYHNGYVFETNLNPGKEMLIFIRVKKILIYNFGNWVMSSYDHRCARKLEKVPDLCNLMHGFVNKGIVSVHSVVSVKYNGKKITQPEQMPLNSKEICKNMENVINLNVKCVPTVSNHHARRLINKRNHLFKYYFNLKFNNVNDYLIFKLQISKNIHLKSTMNKITNILNHKHKKYKFKVTNLNYQL